MGESGNGAAVCAPVGRSPDAIRGQAVSEHAGSLCHGMTQFWHNCRNAKGLAEANPLNLWCARGDEGGHWELCLSLEN